MLGALLVVLGLTSVAWGAATWDESEPGERYASNGRIVAGTILTSTGRLNLKNARYARDDRPLDPAGPEISQRWSRGYLRHLLSVNEPTVARSLTPGLSRTRVMNSTGNAVGA